MPYRSVVLIKQVPDTHNISGKVMTEEGTIDRGALPAIFNPDDLNALEMALALRDAEGGTVTVLTMGPPAAAAILRESLFRGADEAVLLSDKRFAGADTLATSYALAQAVKKIGEVDLVFAGRQAIDGDTAQVGPQTAEKLGIPQITWAEDILGIGGRKITVRRAIDRGTETVECSLPCLLTVVGSANAPRPASVRRRIEYKLAATSMEYKALLAKWPEFGSEEALDAWLAERKLRIPVWSAADIGAEPERLGLAGSPTQVYKVNFVVLEGNESKDVPPTREGIASLVDELVREYIVG
ncbi:MAG TPA: electron transfer flavoprotein subunit beta/FixA family protein [Rectinemataceae bacterium]|nr:electron transfer flavoprotein subunit beta/FixA family protein [Rectinemataceae bacterium]